MKSQLNPNDDPYSEPLLAVVAENHLSQNSDIEHILLETINIWSINNYVMQNMTHDMVVDKVAI